MVSPPPPPPAQAQSLQGSEPLTLFFAAEFMILVVLPFISSQAIYDAFWVCLIGLFLSQMISSALYHFFSGPTTLSLYRSKGIDKLMLRSEVADKEAATFLGLGNLRTRALIAIGLAACIIAYTARQQENYIISCFAGVTVLAFFANVMRPSISTRGITKLSILVLGLHGTKLIDKGICFGAMPVILAILYILSKTGLFDAPEPDTHDIPQETTFLQQSPWIQRVLMVYSDALIAMPIIYIIALAKRYDHFTSSQTTMDCTKAAPGEAVAVPQKIAHQTSPMYRVAISTLITCYAVIDIIVFRCISSKASDGVEAGAKPAEVLKDEGDIRFTITVGCSVLTNAFVPGMLALFAWSRGEGKAWWTYAETWIPSEADLASKEAVVDAEKVAAGPETQSSGTGALNDKLDINIGSHQSC